MKLYTVDFEYKGALAVMARSKEEAVKLFKEADVGGTGITSADLEALSDTKLEEHGPRKVAVFWGDT